MRGVLNRLVRILSALGVLILSAACTYGARAVPTPTFNYIFTPSLISLKIEPGSLPDAQTGQEYEAEIRVSDNATPVNNAAISSGTLPAGLELVFVDHVDGAKISGVPEEKGTFTFTVSFSCFSTMVIGQTGEKDYVLVVK
jgi:hypothetical protein